MPVYEKRDDLRCGSCGHFVRHYIWWFGSFRPLSVGHCIHPRVKDRREGQSCPLWVPRRQEMDPPPDTPGR